MTETILLCEDSPEGIFTGVYTAYEKKLNPNLTHIQLGEVGNYRLFTEYAEVKADREKAAKVERSLRKKLGERTAQILWYAVSSHEPARGDAVYHTIARDLAGAYKGELMDYLQDPYVNLTAKLYVNVWNETHHYMGFVRFTELQSGILYSEIEPKNQVLVFLGEHFSDRFPRENFLIRDRGRNQYLVHRAGEAYFLFEDNENIILTSANSRDGENEHIPTPVYSDEENKIQELFRLFVHTISIEERENKKLQLKLLPLRFRPDMIDFQ